MIDICSNCHFSRGIKSHLRKDLETLQKRSRRKAVDFEKAKATACRTLALQQRTGNARITVRRGEEWGNETKRIREEKGSTKTSFVNMTKKHENVYYFCGIFCPPRPRRNFSISSGRRHSPPILRKITGTFSTRPSPYVFQFAFSP